MRRIFLREDWVGFPMRKDDETEKNNPLRMTNEPLADVTTSYTLNADGTVTKEENKIFEEDEYVVNIGPQHPSTHGVLHFRVSLDVSASARSTPCSDISTAAWRKSVKA